MEENKNTTYEIQEVDNDLVEVQEESNEHDFRMAIGVGIGILGTVLVSKGVSKIKNIIDKRRGNDEIVDCEDFEEDDIDEEADVVEEDSVKEETKQK